MAATIMSIVGEVLTILKRTEEKELSYSFLLGVDNNVIFYLHPEIFGVSVHPESLSTHPIIMTITKELKTIMHAAGMPSPYKANSDIDLLIYAHNLLVESEKDRKDAIKTTAALVSRLGVVHMSLMDANIHIAQLEKMLFDDGEVTLDSA